jgi:hypothetical protein
MEDGFFLAVMAGGSWRVHIEIEESKIKSY